MNDTYIHIVDIAKEVEPPADGILTRTLLNTDDLARADGRNQSHWNANLH